MRTSVVSLVLAVTFAGAARAEDPPTYAPPPTTYTPPPPTTYTPPPTTTYTPPAQPSTPPASSSYGSTTSSSTTTFGSSSNTVTFGSYANPAPIPTLQPTRLVVTPEMSARWSRARNIYGFGSVTGLLGTGLTLSSVLIVAITGYPCNPNDPVHQLNPNDSCNKSGMKYDPPSPTDAVPLLAYLGSSASALGFVFSAAGLGYQHSLLREMNADIGRGTFTGGTVLGVLGFTAVGAGYFFGFTNYLNPHDQGLAILTTTITGAGLCALGSLLYAIDAARAKKAWQRLSTF